MLIRVDYKGEQNGSCTFSSLKRSRKWPAECSRTPRRWLKQFVHWAEEGANEDYSNAGVPRATDPPLRSRMPNQLLFQRSARLNEQAAINRFVRHAHALGLVAATNFR